jgi:hypothetical protein
VNLITNSFQKVISLITNKGNNTEKDNKHFDLPEDLLIVRHKNDSRYYAIEIGEKQRFMQNNKNDLFICTPLSKTGELDAIKMFFFSRSELYISTSDN